MYAVGIYKQDSTHNNQTPYNPVLLVYSCPYTFTSCQLGGKAFLGGQVRGSLNTVCDFRGFLVALHGKRPSPSILFDRGGSLNVANSKSNSQRDVAFYITQQKQCAQLYFTVFLMNLRFVCTVHSNVFILTINFPIKKLQQEVLVVMVTVTAFQRLACTHIIVLLLISQTKILGQLTDPPNLLIMSHFNSCIVM